MIRRVGLFIKEENIADCSNAEFRQAELLISV